MSSKLKSEITWYLVISVSAIIPVFFLLSEFQNYDWILMAQYSEVIWILWIFGTLFCFIGGIVYFLRETTNGKWGGKPSPKPVFFLLLSTIGYFQMARVTAKLDTYLSPTSEKTANGFTIYPPLSASGEQWEQLVELKNLVHIAYGLTIVSAILLLITAFIYWNKRKKNV